MEFREFFTRATGCKQQPFPFQQQFAEREDLPRLVNIPTGLGKTAMALLGWLWRRHQASPAIRDATPRRLVYCLPMRVLVEQTHDIAHHWLNRLKEDRLVTDDVSVYVLMGGREREDWEMYPERDAIIIGTQDMLLSRALNRGYGASRARWPFDFGLLNTDCLWVFDEIQLMGSGLATTAQLEGLRNKLGAASAQSCLSVWMSATLRSEWLRTVDLDWEQLGHPLTLTDNDLQNSDVWKRWTASKQLARTSARVGDIATLASEIVKAHAERGGLTLAVVNTVNRARELAGQLTKAHGKEGEVLLLHSRFRPPDREEKVKKLLEAARSGGAICVSTQVVEAGVDISARTLFTELAPWPSLVQRFGRCNRRGEDKGELYWVDLPAEEEEAEKASAPYRQTDLEKARSLLEKCVEGVSPKALADTATYNKDAFEKAMAFEHSHVVRRKDLLDLFDTTPDLAGNDIDIDRFVREVDETDVRVFWRKWEGDKPPADADWRRLHRDELCPAPVHEFADFVSKQARGKVYRWDFLHGEWLRVDKGDIYPGQTYLVHCDCGGYDPSHGWDQKSKEPVASLDITNAEEPASEDCTDDDTLAQGVWETIAQHTDEVYSELETILDALRLDESESKAVRHAVRWHDRGKAHSVFQTALPEGAPRPALWAKAQGRFARYCRRYFRHELASALSVLVAAEAFDGADADLIAYLVAAHHGKVRLSIRSLPGEEIPEPDENGQPRRFARGVWDRDHLDQVDLGGGVIAPEVALSLEPMELGLCEQPPFEGQPSWLERTLRLRDGLGPFRLAYLEALLRAADWRASAAAPKAADHTEVKP